MPRIAVLADIHGNMPAFEAVLADIAAQAVHEVILAGDLVGRGPQGCAVVHRAMELGLRSVRGNHEDYLISFRRREVPEDWLVAEEWGCSRWMAAELDDRAMAYIEATPFTMFASTAATVQIFHGSPNSNNEGLGPWTPREVVAKHLHGSSSQVLVCAHTHRAHIWRVDEQLAINVGSVGLPFDGDARAQYAILDDASGRWEAELRRVAWSHDALFQVYQESGFEVAGGVTAALLKHEVRTARPHLVPFLRWAEIVGVPQTIDSMNEFLQAFDPHLSMGDQMRRLQAMSERPKP